MIDKNIIEAEVVSCIALCINDFNYGKKEVLITNITNAVLLEFISSFSGVEVHYIGEIASKINGDGFANNNIDSKNNSNKSTDIKAASIRANSKTMEMRNLQVYDFAINLRVNKFDVIIDLDNKTTKPYNELLKDNGIAIINLKDLESSSLDIIKEADFKIRMPFRIEDKYYLFLSNRFHPLADICLQKIDLLNDLKYYNAKIHEAVFALPNYRKEALKGIARN
ncbi:MAG: hypothetical protein K2P17_06695 [Helicobacteraceae bacterium]|nr:hypothetical protein [Helicobacteraceae bacterium]